MRIGAVIVAATIAVTGGAVQAAGFGEQRPVQFRTPNERQVQLNTERNRVEFNFAEEARRRAAAAAAGGALGGEINAQHGENSMNHNTFNQHIEIVVDGEGNSIIVQGGNQQTDQSADGASQGAHNTKAELSGGTLNASGGNGDGLLN